MWDGQERRDGPAQVTKQDIQDILDAAVERHMNSDAHQFVQTMMQREQRKTELWEKIKAQMIGWGLVTLLAFAANLLWQDIIHFIQGLKGKL